MGVGVGATGFALPETAGPPVMGGGDSNGTRLGMNLLGGIFAVPGDEGYDTDQDDLALNAGVGMMHKLNRLLGLRADVRYFHAFVDEGAGKGGYFEDYDFWDVSVGVTLQIPMQRWPDAW